MRTEVVSIGSELLLGQIVDTNAAFIARHLAAIGLDLFQSDVGDDLGRAAAAPATALERADVVITTGGLGPTADDVTRGAAPGPGPAPDQVRVRAAVMTLDRLRRALMTGAD